MTRQCAVGLDVHPTTHTILPCVLCLMGWRSILNSLGRSLLILVLGRFAEFSQACVQRALTGSANPRVIYYGILRKEQKDLVAGIEAQVYRHWDGLESSPPKTRPRSVTDLTVGGLKLLSCSASGPGWPEYIANKFPEGSSERAEIMGMKNSFEARYPPVGRQTAGPGPQSGPARVTGKPDFTIDGGREPLDPERPVDLLAEAPPPVGNRRLASHWSVVSLFGLQVMVTFCFKDGVRG